MLIRFKGMPVLANDLRQDLNRAIAILCGPDGFTADDKQYTVFTLKSQIFVRPNGDLFIDDNLVEDISGQLMEALRVHGFLIEKAEIIEPRKRPINALFTPPVLMNKSPAEDDNIIPFEDLLPETAFDDGRFEEEMREIAMRDPEDDE